MKRFDATPSRLARARREGDHPISRDAVAVAAFAGALFALFSMWSILAGRATDAMRASLQGSFAAFEAPAALAIGLSCAGAALGAVSATVAQTRGLSFRLPAWRLGFARTFNVELLHGVARATPAVAIGSLVLLLTTAPRAGAIARTTVAVILVGTAAAIIDVLAVRAAWRRRLRMTHDELRRDLREQDGDPHVRGRRRHLHRALLRGALREVRRATFVVVNPTHVAVALRYDPPRTPVPEILVRGVEERALRVRKLATQASIPLVHDPALARQLYAHDALGPIPVETYVAVAQIVAFLQRHP